MPDAKLDTPSADYCAMQPYWDMVSDLMGGAAAVRAAGEKYLPRFAKEDRESYEYRRKTAKYVGIYRDIVENLAAKPFSRKVSVVVEENDRAGADLRAIAEDIDGRGNNLHVFSQSLFFHGINDAIGWVLVDFPIVPEGLTVKDLKALNARPYWVHIPARRMLAVRSEMIGSKEQFVHARIVEDAVVQEGYGEKVVRRIRVLNRERLPEGNYAPATWELFEERGERSGAEWVSVGAGKIGIGVIALAPFITGRRKEGSWQFVPPMQDAAYLQVEHYQAESALKAIKDQACFPMLSGSGVSPALGSDGSPAPIVVGPRSVLFAPMNGDGKSGSWSFIEPQGQSLKFLAEDITRIEEQLRELGRQPLTAQTGNLTVVTTAFAASKANSVISAWALNLKDALEQALMFTAWWLGEKSEPAADIETEFDVFLADEKGPETLLKLRERNDISQETLWRELKRRGALSPDFDAAKELERILKEIPGGDDELNAVVPFRRSNAS